MAIADQELKKTMEAVAVLMGWRGDRNKSALLRGELANLQDFIVRLTKGAKQLEQSLNVVNSDMTQAKQDISEQKTQLAELQQGLAAVQQGLQTAQDKLNQLNEDLSSAQESIDNIAEGSSTATQDLAALKQNAGAVITPDPATADLAAVIDALVALKNAVSS